MVLVSFVSKSIPRGGGGDKLTSPCCVHVPKVKDKGCGFIAELRHMTALCEWGVCDRAPQQSVVSFCALEDVNSLDASNLYEAAEQVWRSNGITTNHVAVLSVSTVVTSDPSLLSAALGRNMFYL